jgi:hypothetical protein
VLVAVIVAPYLSVAPTALAPDKLSRDAPPAICASYNDLAAPPQAGNGGIRITVQPIPPADR